MPRIVPVADNVVDVELPDPPQTFAGEMWQTKLV